MLADLQVLANLAHLSPLFIEPVVEDLQHDVIALNDVG